MKKFDVLTFGDICVDMVLSGRDVAPEFGQKEKLVDDYWLEMGGSCTIFACQTAKLGLKTAVAGKAGKDLFGDLVCDTLRRAGVSLDFIKRDPSLKTGVSVALNAGSDRAILTYAGTNDAVEREDAEEELLKSVRHLHIGSYFLMKRMQPHYPEILRKLKSYGTTVSLDTNWDPDETWDSGIGEVIPLVDMVFPNENEAMALTRESSAERAIARLAEKVPIIAIKKGKDGATVYAEGRVYQSPAVDVEMVDAIGAGDSFDAGFVYGFLSGRSMEECVKIGCICGSLSTRAAGGTRAQPALDEVLKYLR